MATRTCTFHLTHIEAASLKHCINYQYAIHQRTYSRMFNNPTGKATDSQILDRHHEAMRLCARLENMIDNPLKIDEDYSYYERYLDEEEDYRLMCTARDNASKRLSQATTILAESALEKIAENFI